MLAARAWSIATCNSQVSVFTITTRLTMPLKKNSKTRTSTVAKSKRNSIFKNDKVGPGTAPLVTALKENNRCLATALGE